MTKVKTIGCEEALKHLLAYLDQEVGAVTHREVEQHLEVCRTCFSRAEFGTIIEDPSSRGRSGSDAILI